MTSEEQKQAEKPEQEDRFSRLFKDVKKGLREFGSAAADKAEEFGKIASEKAEELTKTGKIRLDIMQLNRNRNKLLTSLGEEVFTLHSSKKLKDLEKSESFKNTALESPAFHRHPEGRRKNKPYYDKYLPVLHSTFLQTSLFRSRFPSGPPSRLSACRKVFPDHPADSVLPESALRAPAGHSNHGKGHSSPICRLWYPESAGPPEEG